MSDEPLRLALMIGNSRLHWALLSPHAVIATWDTDYLDEGAIAPLCFHTDDLLPLLQLAPALPTTSSPRPPIPPPLLLASVVPSQTARWQRYTPIHPITLDQLPLGGLYPSLGIDRALAVLGAGHRYGFPVLVVDGGTALTLTGADGDRHIVGGAILPGLRVQGRSLTQHTAALPEVDFRWNQVVPRWATNTVDAMRSGILYTVLAGIHDFLQDWRQRFPDSALILTGGDGEFLLHQIERHQPQDAIGIVFNRALIFEGIRGLSHLGFTPQSSQ